MPTIITHGAVAFILGKILLTEARTKKFWFWTVFCAVLPDADVILFKFGVAYNSFWGHRGFSHSLLFAFMLGLVAAAIYLKKIRIKERAFWKWTLFFTLITASHSIFDALTNGGHGVALFSPFNDERLFFPFTPVEVSPLGIRRFLSFRGLEVLFSELIWIITPLISILLITKKLRRKKQ